MTSHKTLALDERSSFLDSKSKTYTPRVKKSVEMALIPDLKT
jgi:hypothetical protein